MYKNRFIMIMSVIILSLAFVGIAVAADTMQESTPPANSGGVSLIAPVGTATNLSEDSLSTATALPLKENSGIEDISGSLATWDEGVVGDSCFMGVDTSLLCFNYHVQTSTWAWPYGLQMKLPDGWNATSGYLDSYTCSSTGYPSTLTFYGGNQPNFSQLWVLPTVDSCEAVYCMVVEAAPGPDASIPWYINSDGFGGGVVDTCDNSGYFTCDQAVEPPALVTACEMDPIMLAPEEQDAEGCTAWPQEHNVKLWNLSGSSTTVNLTYTITEGNGSCSGPESVDLDDGTSADLTISLVPDGVPDDIVTCEIYAEDAANPDNFDTALIHKTLISGTTYWENQTIEGAFATQWASCSVGTNPAAAGDVAYYVEGLNASGSTFNALQMYDPGTETWTQLAGAPQSLFSHATGWIDGKLYVAGGYSAAFAASTDLTVYDPATDTWDNSSYADLPVPRGGVSYGVAPCHTTGVGNCLYLVGGGIDSSFANTSYNTYEYDPATNLWTQVASMPGNPANTGFILGGGVGCDGKIFAGGDYRGVADFFAYDPSTDSWDQLAAIPADAGKMTPAMVCEPDEAAIYVIGGDSLGYWSDTANDKVFKYDIATDTWEGPLDEHLNVGLLGSCGVYMADTLWTFSGTNGAGPTTPVPHEKLYEDLCMLPPDIDVTPLELQSDQFPDMTKVKEMNVCNLGETPLNWSLKEVEGLPPLGIQDVLWDNGPLVTHPGGGFNGADASALQTALSMSTYGFGFQYLVGYHVADDFTVDVSSGWDIDQITFFGYQTGSPTDPSSFTGIYYQIWDGPPDDPASTIIYGDLVTNRLVSSTWTNIYRVLDTGLTANNRPVMDIVADAGFHLDQGTYWIDFMADGSLSSGPWVPPVTVLGSTGSGNAKQYVSSWGDLIDVGPQDLPFMIEGSTEPPFDIPWLTEDPTEGTLGGSECVVVDATFDSTGLAFGTYTGALDISSDDPFEPLINVPVMLKVGEPDIDVPTALEETLNPNQTGTITFTIGNIGTIDLEWSAVVSGTWLMLDPTSGIVPEGEGGVVDANFDSTGLAPGVYAGTITITSDDPDDSPSVIDVTLTVNPYEFFIPFIHK